VEDLWPDVEWTTDEVFASEGRSPDWLFTHVNVTRLPAFLERKAPLKFAHHDSIGLAVAMALQQRAEPRRVIHYSGRGEDMKINMFESCGGDWAREIFVEYVPTRTVIGEPLGVN
jgi:hypothetical protein